jgi:hypothetical protein
VNTRAGGRRLLSVLPTDRKSVGPWQLVLILIVAVAAFVIVLWAIAGCTTQQPTLPT